MLKDILRSRTLNIVYESPDRKTMALEHDDAYSILVFNKKTIDVYPVYVSGGVLSMSGPYDLPYIGEALSALRPHAV